jgi:hypothetical protein
MEYGVSIIAVSLSERENCSQDATSVCREVEEVMESGPITGCFKSKLQF